MNGKTGKFENLLAVRAAILALLSLSLAVQPAAAAGPDESRPRLAIAPIVTVKGERITVGEISRIESRDPAFGELVRQLTSIDLGESPAPQIRITLPGIKILEAIEKAGIPRDALAYSIPQSVTVERTGRQLTNEEVINAVKSSLVRDDELDLQVREVTWNNAYLVPIGATEIQIERLGGPSTGRLPIRVSVDVDGVLATRFLATAKVDDWRAVPVLNRTVERGETIESDDVSYVRMNMSDQPADLADDNETVVGKRTKQKINAGTAVRRSYVDLPPAVVKGEKVTMIFENGGLRVTAVGLALEDGANGSDLNIRNETSGKTVRARVIGQSTVKVN